MNLRIAYGESAPGSGFENSYGRNSRELGYRGFLFSGAVSAFP